MTNLLLTSIPHFREIIIASFECPHCGARNNEVQFAGVISERGTNQKLKITQRQDLDRQLVKSDHCTVSIPEIELEIPPKGGQLTTIEGLLSDITADLSANQPIRRATQPEVYEKIEALLEKVKAFNEATEPFTVQLDDPSGNSYIEFMDTAESNFTRRDYERTHEQNVALGLISDDPPETDEIQPDEVYTFPSECSACGRPSGTNMKLVNIPYFREVVLMSSNCEHCGYKSNEVKGGGAVSEQGKKITLLIEDSEDLSRDILKSETCSLSIPEIQLDLHPGTLGGRFTTVEGLLQQVHDELYSRVFQGDSSTIERKDRLGSFLDQLKKAISGEMQFTLILDDPLAGSYVQNPYAPDADPNMQIEEYERTHEQNEELGLNDIKVENYGEEQSEHAAAR